MKLAIIGGLGFIGTNLVAKSNSYQCDSKEFKIKIIDNFSSDIYDSIYELPSQAPQLEKLRRDVSTPHGWVSGVSIHNVDISNSKENLFEYLDGADFIIHLAAATSVPKSIIHPINDAKSNIIGLLNVLESSKRVNPKRFIFASSNAPLGNAVLPVNETRPYQPRSPYAISKTAGEMYCKIYSEIHGLKSTVLRFSNVYGPFCYKKTSVVSALITNALNNLPLLIDGDGTQTRDFIYSGDLADAILACTNMDSTFSDFEIFQVATGIETSIIDLSSAIKDILKAEYKINVTLEHTASRIGDIHQNVSSIDKARDILNWSPQTSLHSGLTSTIQNLYSFLKR